MVNNIKAGEFETIVSMKAGERAASIKITGDLWISVKDYTLWLKTYDSSLTQLLLRLLPEFKILTTGQNRGGYYAKLGHESPRFSHAVDFLRRLKSEGVLTKCIDEKELAERCVLSRLEPQE